MLDPAVIFALMIVRPKWNEIGSNLRADLDRLVILRPSFIRWYRVGIISGVAISIGLLLLSVVWPPYYLFSQLAVVPQIYAESTLVNDLRLGENRKINVPVYNSSHSPAYVIGTRSSCKCVVVDPYNSLIPAGKFAMLTLSIRPGRRGRWHQIVICYLRHPLQTQVSLDVFGFSR